MGGNVPFARVVYDPHPTFNGMAVDPVNNVVIMSDENRGSLLTYNLTDGAPAKGTTEPRRNIVGSKVNLGFIAGVTVDPGRREIFTVNNDGGGLVVHSYDSHGDVAPVRGLTVYISLARLPGSRSGSCLGRPPPPRSSATRRCPRRTRPRSRGSRSAGRRTAFAPSS